MKAKIERVAVGLNKPTVITITTEDKASARGLWDDFREVDVDITVKKYRNKRSLDANAYFWKLVGDLAFVLGYTKEEIYIEQVKSCGLYDTVTVKKEAVDTFVRAWKNNGVGWVCERVGENRENPQLIDVMCYYGSSIYDSAQFSRLVEAVITECKEAGIPYETGYFKSILEDK
jgi:hypothetical protein